MKRDLDLIREILLQVEERKDSNTLGLVDVEGRSRDEVCGHVQMLEGAGFVDGASYESVPMIVRLTWEGHDFLDSVRDDSVWSAVKKKLTAVGGSTSIDVLKALVTQVVKGKLGLTEMEG